MLAIQRRPWQFVLSELLALMVVLGAILTHCRQGPEACQSALVVGLPLAGPALLFWGSIFDRRWLEWVGAGFTLLVPLLLVAAAVASGMIAAAR